MNSITTAMIGAALATAGVTGSVVIGHANPAHAEVITHVRTWQPPPRARWMKTPCAQEDSVNCAWNAALNGDGRGHSFSTVKRPVYNADGSPTRMQVTCRYYAAPADARRWDECTLNLPH